MNVLGLAIGVCALILGFVFFPRFLEEKESRAQEKTSDRFSARQRILDTRQAWERGAHGSGGGHIHQGQKGRTMVHGKGKAARLAHERARYAAAISRRAAAARRRAVLVAALATLGAILAFLAGFHVLSWGWIVVPGLALAVTVGLGIRATRIGRANDAVMEARIAKLQAEVTARRSRAPRREVAQEVVRAAHAQRLPRATVPVPAARQDTGERPVVSETDLTAPVAMPERTRLLRAVPAPASESDNEPRRARVVRVEDEADDAVRVRPSGDPFAKSWTPMPVPAPSYQMRPMIQRRDIDTKILIQQQRAEVSGRVPFRPTTPRTPDGIPLTSAEVAQGAPVQFNVDDILESRRVSGN